MRKYILFSILSVVVLIVISLIYLSFYGIKTNKFNEILNERVRNIDSKILLELKDVFLKLNFAERSIRINTKDSKVYIEESEIILSEIDVNLDLIKLLKRENSIKKIKIISKKNSIKNVADFLNSYKFSLPRLVIYNQIKSGDIKATANIYYDKENSEKFNYDLIGEVIDANIESFHNSIFNNINFKFYVRNQSFNFENIHFEYNKIKIDSEKLSIIKSGKNFAVNGDLEIKESFLNPKIIKPIFNFDYLADKNILVNTTNKFSFNINSNKKITDLKYNSKLSFDKIFINPKYQDLIYLNDGIINSEYNNNNLSASIQSKFSFIQDNVENNENLLNLNILKKNNENIKIEGSIKNSKKLIDPETLFKLANINFNILSDKKISIESENRINLQIDKNNKVKDLLINSKLKFDKIFFDTKVQNLIFLENGIVNSSIKNNNFTIGIDSKYSFINEKYNNNENERNIKLNIKKNTNKFIEVESFFKTKQTKINSNEIVKYINIDKKIINDQDITFDTDNKINFIINEENKVQDLKINSILNFDKIEIDYVSKKLKKRIPNYKNQIILNSDYLEVDYSKDKTKIKAKGKYSFNNKFDDYEINVISEKDKYSLESSIDLYNSAISINEIDYKKEKKLSSTIKLKSNITKNNDIKIDHALYSENRNYIAISNLKLSKNFKIKDIDELVLNYLNKNKNKNYLKIIKTNNNYLLIGDHFDGSSLVKNILSGDSNNSFLKIFHNLNSKIILNLNKFYSGHQSYLEKIEGNLNVKNNKIQSGKINALLNKENKFSLNIKTDSKNEKVTNLYIEKPEPFIKNYNFIKGFEGGSLSYDSVEKYGESKSKLKIYDFKVKEVPVLAKLLTLASLQGIADLLTGEGIRFDELEIDYEKKNKFTKIKEMYAVGPAISVLMEGYIEKGKITSLRGTLVPATTVNKIISKIPLLGNVLVGKKIGEGVFGVSFKIKGPPKKLKTTVNPIKSLTPRFITRTIEKLKKTN